jgi:hypothetical protein
MQVGNHSNGTHFRQLDVGIALRYALSVDIIGGSAVIKSEALKTLLFHYLRLRRDESMSPRSSVHRMFNDY